MGSFETLDSDRSQDRQRTRERAEQLREAHLKLIDLAARRRPVDRAWTYDLDASFHETIAWLQRQRLPDPGNTAAKPPAPTDRVRWLRPA